MNSAHKGDIKWFRTKQVDGLQKGGGLNECTIIENSNQRVGSSNEQRNRIQDFG